MSVTLAELKTQIRERADMKESEFVEDSELTSYINASLAELHDLLIAAYNEEYFMEEVSFAATTSLVYDLPNGTNYSGAPAIYKLRGVDVRKGNGDWATVKRFNFNKRNEQQNSVAWGMLGIPYLEYRLVGNKIRFNRTPDSGLMFRIFYYPQVTKLVDDNDSYDDVNGFSEYVVVDVAIKMLNKEESDVSPLMAQKMALKARIEAMAQNRDANEPESITDVYAEETENTIFGRY
jgi:hypothetical protein